MEQTQPWVAHTRRFTQRTVSLPVPLSMLLNKADSSATDTPPSSTSSTPIIDHPFMKIGTFPSMTLSRELLQSEKGPPSTPASTSSDPDNSPERLARQLPLLNSRGSTPLQSESDGEPIMSGGYTSSPSEGMPETSLDRLGKGKAPAIWRPWIHPVGNATYITNDALLNNDIEFASRPTSDCELEGS